MCPARLPAVMRTVIRTDDDVIVTVPNKVCDSRGFSASAGLNNCTCICEHFFLALEVLSRNSQCDCGSEHAM